MTLKTTLKHYQKECVEKLSKIKIGALYMEMGTGKTRTALELINQRIIDGKIDFVLWLCPCSVKNNLKLDIIKHVGEFLDIFRIEGIESLSSSIKLNCELLELAQNKKCYLIVDESNLIKNHKAKRSQNIERLASYCKYKLILNGTPIARNEADLFWQWYILDWRILGYKSFWSFEANHLEYDDYGKIKRVLEIDYIARKIKPYSYQVKKTEVLNLPNKNYHTAFFGMTKEQDVHYDKIADEYLFHLNETKPETIYRLFTALQHVLSGRRLINKYEHSIETIPMFIDASENPRIKRLLDIVKDEKTIIFCKYTHEIKDISRLLGAVEFHGGLNIKKRNEAIDIFRNEKMYMVANKNCGAYGLNLQFCNNIIYYSNDWDFATRQQSEDRLHRIGQEREVSITDLACLGTLDQRILKCLGRKERLSDSFKNSLNKLTKEDRRDWVNGKDI